MTAFLMIPSMGDTELSRRVDFANLASLFSETDDSTPRARDNGPLMRFVATALLVVLAFGDIVLVTRPVADMPAPATSRNPPARSATL